MTRLRSRELPKLYYPTPDELQGAMPLNENLWMRQHQGLMLALANTQEGKDLLCIEDHGLPIIGIRKNAVLYDKGTELMADFRVGAKWSNVVRYRWQEVRRALARMNELFLLKAIRAGVPAGAATLTAYPDAHAESTSVDGPVSRYRPFASTPWETFATLHSSAGDGANASQASGYFTVIKSGTTNLLYALLNRAIFLFDTSAIGAGATASAGVISFHGKAKGDYFSQSVVLTASNPASNTDLEFADYGTLGTDDHAVAQIAISAWDDSGYNAYTLDASGIAALSVDGISKFGLRNSSDFTGAGSPPTWASDVSGNIQGYYADETGTSKDPKLVITYALAFTPKLIMF
jgi:hypothetical protein